MICMHKTSVFEFFYLKLNTNSVCMYANVALAASKHIFIYKSTHDCSAKNSVFMHEHITLPHQKYSRHESTLYFQQKQRKAHAPIREQL